MARIKIEDLPVLEDLSTREIKGIFGGVRLIRTVSEVSRILESSKLDGEGGLIGTVDDQESGISDFNVVGNVDEGPGGSG